MKTELPIIVSRHGKVRVSGAAKPRKEELLVNLTIEIPDSLFSPPALWMRTTVVSPVNGATAAALPIEPGPAERIPAAEARRARAAADGADGPWTGERVRKLRALLSLEREGLASRLGVQVRTVKDWEDGAIDVGEPYWGRLARLEQDVAGVTA